MVLVKGIKPILSAKFTDMTEAEQNNLPVGIGISKS
jgi:hypothetical protein